MAGPACAGPLGQIEPTIATVDDTAVPDRLSISCHLLAVQIGCSLSAQQVPLCLTLQRVSRPFLRVTFFKASWAGTADSRRRRRQYLFSEWTLQRVLLLLLIRQLLAEYKLVEIPESESKHNNVDRLSD